jgi:hypothetical protein
MTQELSLEDKHNSARRVLGELQTKRGNFVRNAKREAESKIEAEASALFDAEIKAATSAVSLAHAAYMAEVETRAAQNAPRPVGTRYVRWERRQSYDRKPTPWTKTTDTGVLEVVTRESRFADNLASYSRPSVGTIILRLCKKDGELGIKFASYDEFEKTQNTWKISTWYPEGEDPNQADEINRKREAEKKQKDWMENPVIC